MKHVPLLRSASRLVTLLHACCVKVWDAILHLTSVPILVSCQCLLHMGDPMGYASMGLSSGGVTGELSCAERGPLPDLTTEKLSRARVIQHHIIPS